MRVPSHAADRWDGPPFCMVWPLLGRSRCASSFWAAAWTRRKAWSHCSLPPAPTSSSGERLSGCRSRIKWRFSDCTHSLLMSVARGTPKILHGSDSGVPRILETAETSCGGDAAASGVTGAGSLPSGGGSCIEGALAAEERSSPPCEDVNRSAEPNSGLEGEPGLVGVLGKEKPCANREGLESGFSGALG